ncbi:bifunctional DNA-formamidopyrimidine glycosylase/DNA-(apurinic or apyrimidinic site) lyase [Xylella taiwanensis]|uniref:Formamidopyrimidine-DNA glycosylase n=1 Tax=Xylella taiwanensis TaxID=1444770 RepID=Z9JG65_9GAMM|nr:bifunctional DNA-formamidopyrimidine glycosylase/DNA-(apurinic or apyrimidinic site) lyase [Xylella taiwanensis]AXI82526.1 5-hydroxymethyluracil DNA glycosylase [Xylella taiwanensis]AXI82605.1 5-hydroxymethyluracil DNA glycosylase [Xylella taiwanensis]EWS76998.1 5-hydroxymethyluracil DNA glycosylase [Xylella taiwanensis]MCD8455516.1 bifunctional DNA-formamidopyrimidine glycosylase/DNA-(apurinic or apyrimidinic site) lyase [Xylella taiwanensis]MCD8455602.1 bifunctional DNA-formamidopyrimidin
MPELPEVETTLRGLLPYLTDQLINCLILRRRTLRWDIPSQIEGRLPGHRITALRRRAKYLLIDTNAGGSLIIHLGMSGSLRLLAAETPLRPHDHVDIVLTNGRVLRFNDPRRFGCLLWQEDGQVHPLIQRLGCEPLSDVFNGYYLYQCSRGRHVSVKAFLMDQRIVVGVGNIYATESLFRAGISPLCEAGKISAQRYQRLAEVVKDILLYAINRGGTTLRDFLDPDGHPGYFKQELFVYGRQQQPCKHCGSLLRQTTIRQRTTVWCGNCQS